jgi:hypothetical protein
MWAYQISDIERGKRRLKMQGSTETSPLVGVLALQGAFALKELVAKEPDPSLLDQLRALEAADHKAFMSKELPSILNNQELPDDIDRELF